MNTNEEKKETILDSKIIRDRVISLGQEISRDYNGKNLLVVGVLKGAFIFMADLVRAINLPLKIDFIQVSSYGASSSSSGSINLLKKNNITAKDHDILLVEDIVDSGLTLKWLCNHFASEKANSVKTCALIDKAERREHEVNIDYLGFSIPKGFLVGYGLDFNEQHRHLPAIYHLTLKKDDVS